MDFSDIRAVLECCEVKSLSRAAKSMYVTPQGLGKIIDRVEKELNTPLFERTTKGIEPTEAGLFFYEKGQKLLRDMREMEQGIEAIRTKNKKLRIGYACGTLRILGVKRMEQFQNHLRPMEIVWEESTNREIKENLRKDRIDIGVYLGGIGTEAIEETEMCTKDMCAIVPEGHPFCENDSIRIRDLRECRIITINEQYQSYINFLNACELAGFTPDIRIRTMEPMMIYRFVQEGLGVGIDADIHEKGEVPDGIMRIPIEDLTPWTVYIGVGKEQASREEIREFLQEFSAG